MKNSLSTLNLRGYLPKINKNSSFNQSMQNGLNSSNSMSQLNSSLRNMHLKQESEKIPAHCLEFVTPKTRYRSHRYDEKNSLDGKASNKFLKVKDQSWAVLPGKESYKLLYTTGRKNKKASKVHETKDQFLKISKGDHIVLRYEIHKAIGKGSFGQVFKAWDHKTDKFVAIKILKNNPTVTAQSEVEIDILKKLKKNKNVIKILSSFTYKQHVCIVFELLSKNLYQVVKQSRCRGLALKFVRSVAFQVLGALKEIHAQSIIHCDVKPENIILKKLGKTDVKMIDFGSSCYTHKKIFTYIQSRFYRAPEIPLGISYTTSIDMWSFGCLLFELFMGYPLFPAETEFDLLSRIIEVLGQPSEHTIDSGSRSILFFENRIFKQPASLKKRVPGTKKLSEIIKSPVLTDLILSCLKWNSHERPTADEALKHQLFR